MSIRVHGTLDIAPFLLCVIEMFVINLKCSCKIKFWADECLSFVSGPKCSTIHRGGGGDIGNLVEDSVIANINYEHDLERVADEVMLDDDRLLSTLSH